MASVAPVSKVNWGLPFTITISSNVTVIATRSPILYIPSWIEDDTAVTVAGLPSTTISFVAANDPVESGSGNVKSAIFVAASLMVPPFNTNDVVST